MQKYTELIGIKEEKWGGHQSWSILGDPGATSRDDAIFSGERQFLARKFISRAEEPLGTFSYQTSSRSVEIRPPDWPDKYFSGQSTRRSSRVILSPFYTKWFCLHRSNGKILVRSLSKKDLTKPRKSQTVTWDLEGACAVISRLFPGSDNIIAWSVQRWFAYRRKAVQRSRRNNK